jgi:hypothetical protein
MSFQIHALSAEQFEPLFSMTDEALAEINARRKTVDTKPGYPCRVSLVDAEPGETVILTNYLHQSANSPFQSSHAIYVRENVSQAFPEAGSVPEFFNNRLVSVRGFDKNHHIVDADMVEGEGLSENITKMMGSPQVEYLHLHNAKLGCYIAWVTRT